MMRSGLVRLSVSVLWEISGMMGLLMLRVKVWVVVILIWRLVKGLGFMLVMILLSLEGCMLVLVKVCLIRVLIILVW